MHRCGWDEAAQRPALDRLGVGSRGSLLIRLCRHVEPDAFIEQAGPFLLEREAEHCLILGLSAGLRAGDDAYLAVIEQDGAVVAAALQTPPRNLIVSHMAAPAALDALTRDVQRHHGHPPGVVATKPLSLAFARRWQELTGQRYHLSMAMRLHETDAVQVPRGVPGELRRAEPADRELLIDWAGAFEREALGSDDPAGAAALVDDGLRLRRLYLWWDGGPAAMASSTGATANGIRIGHVFTPPDLRGRGYASACTAALTQCLLDQGRRSCYLFTDLANPVSNRIYARIGYRPVCDVDEYRFTG